MPTSSDDIETDCTKDKDSRRNGNQEQDNVDKQDELRKDSEQLDVKYDNKQQLSMSEQKP